ncbi:T-cell leukemia translocation-altered gene [Pelobates cultripes]|uniref:T-cell leukemia translocation-altered gene protein homolog n=2 Tax=Pelobates cultripes TaxID=61616 RepID=A0AAD1SXW9_PELCU|nr:T-cell leukemia translocation-altered gene [Pelobates cultripes]
MAETWDSEWLSQALGYLLAMSADFAREWESNDMRAAIFKVLLGWIVLSVTAIQLAWKFYGPTVNSIYYRQGMGGQNGGTPDYSPNFPIWESSSMESLKTHQE